MIAVHPDRAGGASPARSLFGYDVIDRIGEGAGSMIYVVSEPQTRQLYALKHCIRRTDKDARFIEQLKNEFEVSKAFAHPTLRKSLGVKESKTWMGKVTEAALLMELFDGMSMDLQRPGDLLDLIHIFIQTAQGLQALHAAGLVHCDLKPNNILIGSNGNVKVIDFGQACKTGTVKERIQGTPDYIAPEQVHREAVTFRTDVFNYGATLYWALAGRNIPTLFTVKKDENSFLLDTQITTPIQINPSIPEPLSNLAMECIRTVPAKRPDGMATLIHRLEVIQHSLIHRLGRSPVTMAQ